jgi:peroxiredoxin
MAVHSRSAGVGSTAPDFELADAGGATHRLSRLVENGPVVLVFLRGFG